MYLFIELWSASNSMLAERLINWVHFLNFSKKFFAGEREVGEKYRVFRSVHCRLNAHDDRMKVSRFTLPKLATSNFFLINKIFDIYDSYVISDQYTTEHLYNFTRMSILSFCLKSFTNICIFVFVLISVIFLRVKSEIEG